MGRAMTYGELDRLSRAFAGYLATVAGLKRGARVALMMPNLLQYPVALFGALRAGLVVVVNCNPLYSPRELHHQLVNSGAEAIVVLENFAQTLEKAIEGTGVRAIVVTGVGDLLQPGRTHDHGNFVVRRIRRAVPALAPATSNAFLKRAVHAGAGARAELPRVEAEDVAFLQYTGGTTGRAEGRDADPSQHDRRSSCRSPPGSRRFIGRGRRDGSSRRCRSTMCSR